MGLGFRLNLKWGIPINSHSHSNSPSKRLSSSLGELAHRHLLILACNNFFFYLILAPCISNK